MFASILEYPNVVWNPFTNNSIIKLETVQRIAYLFTHTANCLLLIYALFLANIAV